MKLNSQPINLLVTMLLLCCHWGHSQQNEIRKTDAEIIRSLNNLSQPTAAPRGFLIADPGPQSKKTEVPSMPAIQNSAPRTLSEPCADSSFKKMFEAFNWSYSYSISAKTADGGVLIGGYGRDRSLAPPYAFNGLLSKFDSSGNHIWSREITGSVQATILITMIKELSDGTIIISAPFFSNNYTIISQKQDFLIARFSATGNVLWSKTFNSNLNTCNDGRIQIKAVTEDNNGNLLFTGFHSNCFLPIQLVVFKLSSSGMVQWKYYYNSPGGDSKGIGIFYANNEVTVIARTNTLSAGADITYQIDFLKLSNATGTLLSGKGFIVNKPYPASFYYSFTNSLESVQLNNGNYCVYGQTFGSYNYIPADTSHFSVLEFNPGYDFVKGYSINSAVIGNPNVDHIKVDKNGQGIFSITTFINISQQEIYIGSFKNGVLSHNRHRSYLGWEPFWDMFETFGDGSYAYIKNLATPGQSNFYLEYSLLHNSDTSSECLGEKTDFSRIVPVQYIPHEFSVSSIHTDPFEETINNTISTTALQYSGQLACQQTGLCDTLKIKGASTSCNLEQDFLFTAALNQSCGARVRWILPDSIVQDVQYINDTSVRVRFNQPWKGWMFAEINNGCGVVRDSVYIAVLPSPGIVSLGADQQLCPGNTVLLNARSGYASYLWQDSSRDSVFTVTQAGLYHVIATDACGGIFKDSVLIGAAPPIPFNLGPDRTTCNDDTVHLSAPAGFISYNWSPDHNINSVVSQNVIVAPGFNTTYFIKAEKTPGCFAFDTVQITVHQSPPVSLGADKSFCGGDSAVFSAGAGFQSYLWSNSATTQNITAHTHGSYAVTATTMQGCKSFDTVRVVNVYPLPAVTLNKKRDICAGESKVLDGGNFVSYAWNTGATTQSITVNAIGTYAVMVSDANGCKGGDTTAISTINPPPIRFLPADTTICSYGKLELKPAAAFNRYSWSSGSIASWIIITQPGIYWLDVTDTNACRGRDSVIVNPKDCLKGFYVPTAFTPNSDGNNDVFQPLLFGPVKQYRFTIFNRWGEVVFQSNAVQRGWDGKSKTGPMPSGVFVWTCAYQLEGETAKSEKGTVVLIR